MALLPAQNNFADLSETANALGKSSKDDSVKRLAALIGTLAYRSDLLEREVERLSGGDAKPAKKSKIIRR
jgi:hypothetical protein